MKKIYFFAFFLTVVNSNAQNFPCTPWPWCEINLDPIVIYPVPPPPTGPVIPAPPIFVPNVPSPSIPCPGTPMKDMRIAPSGRGGWNKKGGTYGYTRSDDNGNPKFHDGIDIAGDIGSNIHNMYEGTVTGVHKSFSPNQYMKNSYGNFVRIESTQNGEKFTLKYNHLNSVSNIKVGDVVSQGQALGTLGKTGNAGDPKQNIIPHVHLQAKDAKGKRTNPDKYLNAQINNQTGDITANCK